MANQLLVSSSGAYFLGHGGDQKSTNMHFSIEGTWTGNLNLLRCVAGDPTGTATYFTPYASGTVLLPQTITSNVAGYTPSSASDMWLSASSVTGLVAINYQHVAASAV